MDERIEQVRKFAEGNDIAGIKSVPLRLHFHRECYECHHICMYWGGYFEKYCGSANSVERAREVLKERFGKFLSNGYITQFKISESYTPDIV